MKKPPLLSSLLLGGLALTLTASPALAQTDLTPPPAATPPPVVVSTPAGGGAGIGIGAVDTLGGLAGGDLEGPYKIQSELQDLMQANVGIVRNDADMKKALQAIQELKQRAGKVASGGNRDYNPGWHTALDLKNLLTVSEAVTLAAIERKESRGGHFREDHPDKDPSYGTFNFVVRRGPGGRPELRRETIPPLRDDLKRVVEENK